MSATNIEMAQPSCIIHWVGCNESLSDNLTSPRDSISWLTLKEVAICRNFEPLLTIADEHMDANSVPSGVFYHRQCRQHFMLRLPSTSAEANAASTQGTVKQNPVRVVPQMKSRTLPSVCVFCRKVKCLPKTSTKEHLVQCMEGRAEARIREYAKITQHDYLLGVIGCTDLIAAEAKYHLSCYQICKRITDNNAKQGAAVPPDVQLNDYTSGDSTAEAYQFITDYIERVVFVGKQVITLAEIADMYVSKLLECGQSVSDSTKRNLRRKLERTFDDSLHFCQASNGRVICWPDSLTMDELVLENHKLRLEVQQLKSSETDRQTIQTATKIRSDIRQMQPLYEFPYVTQFSESCTGSANGIPVSLQVLLSNIIACSADRMTSQQLQRMNSIAGDLIYTTTAGRIKMPKHVLLPFGIKSLTGNVEVIHILNRLGHGIAYSQLLEIETAIAMQQQQNSLTVPASLLPHVFTTLAWDNIDNSEETLSGEGTSHRVNGIAIQNTVRGSQPYKDVQVIARTRKRSFQVVDLPLPTYTMVQRVGPGKFPVADVAIDTTQATASLQSNLLWAVCRLVAQKPQSVPSWTGFNICTRSEHVVIKDKVAYLSPIDSPASSMATVWELLNRSVQIQKELSLPSIVCVFDQALYAKAAEVVWAHPDKFASVVLCLGVFHTVCTLIRIIGKRFGDAGLRDLLVESGIVAEGSVSAVLDGRHYNRAMRAHKLIYEAMLRLAWVQFYDHVLSLSSDAAKCTIAEAMYNISQLNGDLCESQFHSLMELESVQFMLTQFNNFLSCLRQDNGELSTFWMSYVDIVNLMLDLVRASREGNWNLHLASVRSIIPWCFAYDRSNYARYLPVYLAHMSNLEQEHPEVKHAFENGSFSVQMSEFNTFGRIPVDQTIEETVNRDTKTAGGTCGFSRNFAAVSKHFLAAGMTSNCLKQLRILTRISHNRLSHADLTFSRIQHDERDVVKAVELLTSSWIDPFAAEKTDLVCLSSGKAAPMKVADNLLKASEYGEKAYQHFKNVRLHGDATSVANAKFHDPLPRLKLQTFANAVESKVIKSKDRTIIMKSDKNLFGKMILIGQTRKLQMSEVLSHPLGPIPYELANADGTIRKNNKSSLGREILKKAAMSTLVLNKQSSAYIVDGMAMVHRLPPNLSTFGDFADALQRMIMRDSGECNRVDVVFDVYRDISIKGGERDRRSQVSATKFSNIQSGHKVQQWKKFLSTSCNKMQFINFVTENWTSQNNLARLGNKTLYLTNGEACCKLINSAVEAVSDLTSSHEEADTRLLLHARHAALHGVRNIVVVADDTDVLVLLIAFANAISADVYMKSGHGGTAKIHSISKIAKSMAHSVCEALPGMHAFTGCDSVSAFAGKGKVNAYKLMCKSLKYQQAFTDLGSSWTMKPSTITVLEAFVCQLYGGKSISDINDCRYKLFCSKKGEVESSQLPPCRDCLNKHSLRSNYQAGVWRRCLESNPKIPSPNGHGWTVSEDGDSISIDWMDGTPAPTAVLELLSCQCKKICSNDCPCVSNNMKCTDMCRLQGCNNSCDDHDESVDFPDNDAMDSAGDLYSDEEDESCYSDNDDDASKEPIFCPDMEEEVEVETDITTDTSKANIVMDTDMDADH